MYRRFFRNTFTCLVAFVLLVPIHILEVQAQKEVEVETRTKNILTIDGKRYRDLNDNGKLDPYENWELPTEERVSDLLSQMTIEEKVGLLTINEFPEIKDNKLVFPNKFLNQNTRYFIYREMPTANIVADHMNQLQIEAEKSRLGIPAIVISNPRNHPLGFPVIEETGQFSHWPDTLGLAAGRDSRLIRRFGEIARKEWRAAGIHKLYGYSADLVTDPLWARNQETFGEHPDLVSGMVYNVIKGLQGDVLDNTSVSVTTKHFPGGGARAEGRDPHFEEGQYNIYPTPGSLLKYHIPPFKAAIEAETTSIMPYYAYPSNESAEQGLPPFSENEQFEEVAFALNESFINGYLRDELNFLGYVNSDTSAVIDRAWGAQDLSLEERFAKALNAGTNIFSGVPNPEPILNAVNQGLVEEEKINRSARYALTEMMNLGLFDNPYVNPDQALTIANDPKSQEVADDAHRRSVVLLRNDNNLLPLQDDTISDIKLYVEVFSGADVSPDTEQVKQRIRDHDEQITIVDNIEDATHAFVWVKPWQDLFANKPSIEIGPDTGVEQVDQIVEIQKAVPTITAIDFSNPWLINKIEPNAQSLIATFGTKTEAIIEMIRGEFNPVGKLPITIPASQEAVNNEAGDVPGYDEAPTYPYQDKAGNRYQYNFGLTY
ncbi:glycoside hydrolase family 3 protein [Ornithinibacillus halotolerans]|uniref:beta-glucosidase n=1 Tax=Ornithinibacillus halotolerans TaxID=1274357 RepID=A0A916W2C8_9BACI|nr:glycoside hydrolase family 3 N-terminal domain-containing protein [Ornithinibacillus halotolerans]GGA61891.1 beta-glucosidase [Ornithinibacillus halotolerans]